jgi:hypothetical protein
MKCDFHCGITDDSLLIEHENVPVHWNTCLIRKNMPILHGIITHEDEHFGKTSGSHVVPPLWACRPRLSYQLVNHIPVTLVVQAHKMICFNTRTINTL